MIVPKDENGISHCPCNGDHFILVHNDSKVILKGVHSGLTSTGSPNTIEYFETEEEMEDRINELGLVDA